MPSLSRRHYDVKGVIYYDAMTPSSPLMSQSVDVLFTNSKDLDYIGSGAQFGYSGAKRGAIGSRDSGVIYYDAMQQTWLRVVLISLYVVIFVLGVAGNSIVVYIVGGPDSGHGARTIVVYIVAARRAMQSITNIFIANLAVSDVIMCLLAVPFTPISGLLQSWPFGEALCHLVPMTMTSHDVKVCHDVPY